MILVLNQYYAPDNASSGQYAADICNGLAARGMTVYVVTGQPSYSLFSSDAPSYEFLQGVHVNRVQLGKRRGRENMKTRVAGYIRFLFGAWKTGRILLKSQACQAVLTFSNPPIIGFVGARLARKHGLRFISVLHDIHPDILLASGWKLPRPIIWAWEIINKTIFRQADTVIVLNEGMKQTLLQKKKMPPEKIRVIPLWGRPELMPTARTSAMRREWKVEEDELLFLSAGNMGIMHPLDAILDAAKALVDLPVRFLFIGEGAQRNHLMNRVEKEKIGGVNFLPYQSEERFVRLLRTADICLAGLQQGLEDLAFPSRVITYMSAARPVITIMKPQTSVARWITEDGCGWNVANGRELTGLILELLKDRSVIENRGLRARELYEERFKKSKIINEYVNMF